MPLSEGLHMRPLFGRLLNPFAFAFAEMGFQETQGDTPIHIFLVPALEWVAEGTGFRPVWD